MSQKSNPSDNAIKVDDKAHLASSSCLRHSACTSFLSNNVTACLKKCKASDNAIKVDDKAHLASLISSLLPYTCH